MLIFESSLISVNLIQAMCLRFLKDTWSRITLANFTNPKSSLRKFACIFSHLTSTSTVIEKFQNSSIKQKNLQFDLTKDFRPPRPKFVTKSSHPHMVMASLEWYVTLPSWHLIEKNAIKLLMKAFKSLKVLITFTHQ